MVHNGKGKRAVIRGLSEEDADRSRESELSKDGCCQMTAIGKEQCGKQNFGGSMYMYPITLTLNVTIVYSHRPRQGYRVAL